MENAIFDGGIAQRALFMKMMKGAISSWNDDKGFGFISTGAARDRLFVHIKAFSDRRRRPAAGDLVTFSLSKDDRGRPCAKAASIVGSKGMESSRRAQHDLLPDLFAVIYLLAVAGAVLLTALPLFILLVYLVASIAAFVAYALDKSAARMGGWRTPENTLHILALAGGWPGALVAQNRLRHKSRKQPFRVVFWGTVLLNCAMVLWLLTAQGAEAWNNAVSWLRSALSFTQ